MRSRYRLSILLTVAALFLHGCSSPETKAPPAPEPERVTPGEMVKIPAGEFTQGSDVATTGEKRSGPYAPARKVNLPDFWIDTYEVTNGEFMKFSAESDYKALGDWRPFAQLGTGDHPVVNVVLADAVAYCKWRGRRLPTEGEWEKAARGVDGRDYPWGAQWESGKANTYESGHKRPVEVGGMAGDISPFGVHDMFGNVQEWTASAYKAYPGGPRDEDYGLGMQVVRGGSSAGYGNARELPLKIWFRRAFPPESQFGTGFRCASDSAPGT